MPRLPTRRRPIKKLSEVGSGRRGESQQSGQRLNEKELLAEPPSKSGGSLHGNVPEENHHVLCTGPRRSLIGGDMTDLLRDLATDP